MSRIFRDSPFVDFNAGTVTMHPMKVLQILPKPLDFKGKVYFFHCRVEVWILSPAVQVLKEIESNVRPSAWSDAAYGMMAMSFVYFEMIGKIVNPNSAATNSSSADFNFGFCDVYPEYIPASGNCGDTKTPDAVNQFRNRIRNGIYHLAWTKKGLWIHNELSASTKDFDIMREPGKGQPVSVYLCNPHSMVQTIVDHFPTLIQRLISPDPQYDGMRQQFEKFVDTFYEA
jgi:hypothetical protein